MPGDDPKIVCLSKDFRTCALRAVKSQASLPRPWSDDIALELASFPTGRQQLYGDTDFNGEGVRSITAVWMVHIQQGTARFRVAIHPREDSRIKENTFSWRPLPTLEDLALEATDAVRPPLDVLHSLIKGAIDAD